MPLPPQWLEQQRHDFLGDQDLVQVLETRVGATRILISIFDVLRRCDVSLGNALDQGWKKLFVFPWRQGSCHLFTFRVRDAGLARELWIRLEEAKRHLLRQLISTVLVKRLCVKGVIGPMPIGLLQPEVLQEILRSLRPGELSPPCQLGEWHV